MTEPSTDTWAGLRRLTAARIGLARSGASLATAPLLEFKLAHARARDAVHAPLDQARLVADLASLDLESLGLESLGVPVRAAASAAADRQTYLMRPDLGRRLADDAVTALAADAGQYDVAIVIADGLSAGAVQAHARPVLAGLLPMLRHQNVRVAPLVVVLNGRVAIGDTIATLLGADCAAVLIGERPGLTAPDSMGAYLTWRPSVQTTDAARNCVSNIRPDGIGYADAAAKLAFLLAAIRGRRLSGVALKDEQDALLSSSSPFTSP
jgi:ethanolamine ammonia-lyase small subunit